MRSAADIVIGGGGVIGLTLAYTLLRRGVRVTVLDDAAVRRPASWAGAGIIPPGNERSEWLRGFSSGAFPRFSDDLLHLTGVDNGYIRCGGLERGVGDETVQLWRREGLRFETRSASAGYFLPDYAQVRNPRHLQALRRAIASLGGALRPDTPIRAWKTAGDRVRAAVTPAGTILASQFVVASGAWSPQLTQHLGWTPDIVPIRGQIVAFRAAADLLPHLILDGKRYLVPRFDGLILAGSTEESAGFDDATTPAGVRELTEFAAAAVPELADAPIERAWAGLRPGNRDGRPTLGRIPGWANAFVAAGHFRSGIQQSPATAELLASLLLGEPPPTDPRPFAPDRPIAEPARSAFKS